VSPLNPVRLVVIEDHSSVRQVLAQALEATLEITVVGQASTAAEGIACCREHRPDVILLDALLPDDTGLEKMRQLSLASPKSALLVYSGSIHTLLVNRALVQGARGFVEKAAEFGELVVAIKHLRQGLTYFSPRVSEVVRQIVAAPSSCSSSLELTEVERAILAKVASGQSSKEIASDLSRSPFTIENHRRRIMQKTGRNSVAELTLLALELGLIANVRIAPL
jgi:DNA-binding NarL/FixJ family response regulator